MTDYIERDAALSHPFANGRYDHEHADKKFISGHESYREWLEQLPAADVRPVVRGGKILRRSIYGKNFWACKECLQEVKAWFAFCPRCGADLSEQEVMPNERSKQSDLYDTRPR